MIATVRNKQQDAAPVPINIDLIAGEISTGPASPPSRGVFSVQSTMLLATVLTSSIAASAAAPPTSSPQPIFTNAQIEVQEYLAQNVDLNSDCTPHDEGTWTVISPPAHGKITTEIASGPYYNNSYPSFCAYDLVLQNYVYYTYTGGDLTASTDTFTLEWAGDYGTYDYVVTATLEPRLVLLSNMQDVTGLMTTVAVGETAGVGALNPPGRKPPGRAPTTAPMDAWNAPGTKVMWVFGPNSTSQAICNASVPCPQYNSNNLSAGNWFSWTNGGKYRETYTWCGDGVNCGTVWTNYHVVAPTSVGIPTVASSVAIVTDDETNGPAISFGTQYPLAQGMTFQASASQPAGYNGVFQWVQVLSKYNITIQKGSTTIHCSTGAGLDMTYPYAVVNSDGTMAVDSPSVPLKSSYSQVSVDFAAKMYLEWNPQSSPSIFVPLGYVDWGWTGVATNNNGVWSVTSGAGGPLQPLTISSDYPQWDKVDTGTTTCN